MSTSAGRVPAWQPTRSITNNAIHLDDLQISFQRTVRMPDNRDVSKLPPNHGRFSLYNVSEFSQNMSPEMASKGGIFFPMYVREAMWIKFVSRKPYAIQVHVGSINAISGRSFLNFSMVNQIHRRGLRVRPVLQDYMIVPAQKWLDGIAVAPGVVRQFVAMTKESQRSIEFQITGQDCFCGLMISVTPHMPEIISRGIFDRPRNITLRINPIGSENFEVSASSDDTVDDLKIRIEDLRRLQYPRAQQELLLHGNTLDGHRRLEFYGIENQTLVSLMVDLRGGMQIYVKTLSGNTMSLECGISDTIETIKEKIHLKSGVSPIQQKLVYRTEILDGKDNSRYQMTYEGLAAKLRPDDKTLSDYNISQGALIYLGMRLFGGSGAPGLNLNDKSDVSSFTNGIMEMSLAAGGQIAQTIVEDTGAHYFDYAKTIHFNVQILNSQAFQRVTRLPAPETPIDATTYAELGYPFFEMWEEPSNVSGNFSAVRSLAELDETIEESLPEGHRVVTIRPTAPFFRDPETELLPPLVPREIAEANLAESNQPRQAGPGPWPGTGLRTRMRQPER